LPDGHFTTDLTELGNMPNTKLVVFDNATDALNDTVCFTLTFTAPDEEGIYNERLSFAAAGMSLVLLVTGEALPREQVQPMIVQMETTSAKVGEVATVRLLAQTPIPSQAASAVVSMQYNATVLAPEFEPVTDRIEGGVRFSTFKTSVVAGQQGLFASMPFRILLGNSSSSELTVGVFWLDGADEAIEMGTQVIQGTVSVEDADGLLVNPDAGPLSISLSSMPVRRGGSPVLSYRRGGESVRLYIVNDLGAVVADMSSSVTSESGSIALPVSSLASGTYTIQLVGGRHRFIHRMVVE